MAEASVQDVNRQTWTSAATMLVHPASLYVGLKSEKTFVQQGEPLVVQSIVTDLDGKAIANREVKMHAVLLDWKQVEGEWTEVETNPTGLCGPVNQRRREVHVHFERRWQVSRHGYNSRRPRVARMKAS